MGPLQDEVIHWNEEAMGQMVLDWSAPADDGPMTMRRFADLIRRYSKETGLLDAAVERTREVFSPVANAPRGKWRLREGARG